MVDARSRTARARIDLTSGADAARRLLTTRGRCISRSPGGVDEYLVSGSFSEMCQTGSRVVCRHVCHLPLRIQIIGPQTRTSLKREDVRLTVWGMLSTTVRKLD